MDNQSLLNLPLAVRETALDAMRFLFSYPYSNLLPQMISRTREFEDGFVFSKRCRELLEIYHFDLPFEEYHKIECDVTFLELSLLDDLNRWQEYLDYFEIIYAEKRSPAYISHYQSCLWPDQTDEERFGRYFLGYAPDGCALVHNLYLHDDRRSVIERKVKRLREGKSVEHLKRHQKAVLTSEEQKKRFLEMEKYFHRLKRYDSWTQATKTAEEEL